MLLESSRGEEKGRGVEGKKKGGRGQNPGQLFMVDVYASSSRFEASSRSREKRDEKKKGKEEGRKGHIVCRLIFDISLGVYVEGGGEERRKATKKKRGKRKTITVHLPSINKKREEPYAID